jgi:hypothetical protein
MAEPTREQIFRLAAQHCDQAIGNRDRSIQGWNFSKSGLLAFVQAARELAATDAQAERARWDAHIRMARHFYRDGVETGSGEITVARDA